MKEWYFTNDHVDEIVDYFIEFLRKKYALKSTQEVIASTAFLSNQTAGKSQKIILSRLSERIQEQYGITLVTLNRINVKTMIANTPNKKSTLFDKVLLSWLKSYIILKRGVHDIALFKVAVFGISVQKCERSYSYERRNQFEKSNRHPYAVG